MNRLFAIAGVLAAIGVMLTLAKNDPDRAKLTDDKIAQIQVESVAAITAALQTKELEGIFITTEATPVFLAYNQSLFFAAPESDPTSVHAVIMSVPVPSGTRIKLTQVSFPYRDPRHIAGRWPIFFATPVQ